MRALIDLARGLSSALEPEYVAQLLMLTLSGRWAVRRYALVAWKKNHPPVIRCKGMSASDIVGIEIMDKHPDDLPDALRITDLPDGFLKNKLINEMAEVIFPIKGGAYNTGGLVILGNRFGNQSYTDSDLEFGAGLIAQASVAFENSWFVKEAIEQKKVEQELELAANIQSNLFPATLPKLEGFDLAARNRPAQTCGGDYYDAIEFSSDEKSSSYLICVADVSGKGLPASLLMSNMQATMRALLGRVPTLNDLAAETNSLIYSSTPDNKYITAMLLELDPKTSRGKYVNAGHVNCLLLRANGEAEWLSSTGVPLGLMPKEIIDLSLPYHETDIQLYPGDILALYSDGVTEALDEEENEYGEEPLANFLRSIASEPANDIAEKIITEIDKFAGNAPQHDDITLFILKKTC